MTEVAESDPKSLILVIADMARSNPPMTSAVRRRARAPPAGPGLALALPLTWIEQRLAESGQTIEQLVQSETQQQAADQVSISNSIGSLRFLGAMDWREFVETMSVVEQTLREDPAGVYGRWTSRRATATATSSKRLAKRSPLPESEVAQAAIALARERRGRRRRDHAAHVGYYLVDAGPARSSSARCACRRPLRGACGAAIGRFAAVPVPRRDRC